jgi:hypothetical protein
MPPGVDFYKAIFEAAVLTVPGVATRACHVRDWALADDAPARAVLALNSMTGNGVVFGYAGFTWNGYIRNDGQAVHANVEAAVLSHLHVAVKAGVNIIPGFTFRASASSSGSTAPKRPVAPDNLKHCAIRGKHFPIKQSVHDVWDAVEDPQIKAAWKELVKTHNATLNPDGTPWKSRRPASCVETDESLEEQNATRVPPASKTLDDLKVPPAV